SYLRAAAGPKPTAVSFEDWVVQRFGRRLYQIFFKTYTEKVWGMPCTEISADWAAQRIKGLSLYRAVKQSLFGQGKGEVVKTLIDQFEYPRFGPGMMWEHLAAELAGDGVPVHLGATVARIGHRDGRVVEIDVDDAGGTRTLAVGGAISSMPLRSLVAALDPAAPEEVQAAAGALRYRDFLTVVLVIDRPALFPDNWIYIHEPSVKVGRIQNFKNWSPHMVPDPSRTCLGLEYFCFEGDGLWSSSDAGLVAQATAELQELRLAGGGTVIDGTVVRMPKAYPVYDDAYRANVAVLRDHLATVTTNLELCGRNGMHKYNNQDHAMMTALMAARNMAGEAWDQWLVNEDAEYHEEERASEDGRMVPGPAQSPART
ncbi:MAG: FAD-dependent oxidoreductase, partial [Acidimicrobiales bacterium]